MATIRRRTPRSQRNKDGLIKYARDVTSQSGEDGIIEKIFQMLPFDSTKRSVRYCVDVGAWDGQHLSNTFHLLSCNSEKWKGLLIEANYDRYLDLKKLHDPLGNTCLNLCVSCQPASDCSLSKIILNNFAEPIHTALGVKDSVIKTIPIIDFLCIDVDGTDYWLMKDALTLHSEGIVSCNVICCEFNPTIPDDLIYIQEQSDSTRHGSSLSALVELATQYNFTLIETTLYNAFFIQNDLFFKYLHNQIPIRDTTIEALHELTMGTQLYQLYDGCLKLSGCKRMLWHRLRIDEESIQMLPKNKRVFPFAPPQLSTADIAVDMSPYCRTEVDQSSHKKECANKLLSALKKDGFAIIRGTGMTSKVSHDALKVTHSFFNEANESVRRTCLAKDRARRGYSPMNSENFASLIGEKGPNDLVRKFRIGPERKEDNTSHLYHQNSWPNPKVWGEDQASLFKSSIEKYYSEICRISHSVLEAIRDGLLLIDPTREQYLQILSISDINKSHTSILTLLSYKKGARHQGKMKTPLVAPHTDVGVITVLRFDSGDCATLQRYNNSSGKRLDPDSWIDVNLDFEKESYEDPLFVINIGDFLSEVSGFILPSTLHRVQPKKGLTSRNCLALFVGLNPEAQINMKNQTITYEEWRRNKIECASKLSKGH